MYGLSQFISKFKAGARPNLFRVEIDVLGEFCSFVCKGAQIPGRGINKMPIAYMDNQFYIGGDTIYQDWTVTVINDTNFDVRFKLEEWMNLVKNQGATKGYSGLGYLHDTQVIQMDALGEDIVRYKLFNAFPIDISPIDLDWATSSMVEEYQVIFSFSHFGKE